MQTINTAPTALMVTVGFTPEQAARIIQVRRVLPLVEDRKAPCIDARKLWERIGKPHGRFNDWATAYIKPLTSRTDLTTEISVLKIAARGTPRTDYILSRDIAANLAMLANTAEGAGVRAYFLDMEELAMRLAKHLGVRVSVIVEIDNKVTHMFIKQAGDDVKAGNLPKALARPTALNKERLLKATVWRETFGRGVRDVLDSADILIYSQCYETARALIACGIRSKPVLLTMLTQPYGGRVTIDKYTPTLRTL